MSILSDLFKTNNKEGTDLNEEEQKEKKKNHMMKVTLKKI